MSRSPRSWPALMHALTLALPGCGPSCGDVRKVDTIEEETEE